MSRSSAAEALGYEDPQERLIRKQFLISSAQESKLKELAKEQEVSAGEIVRRAIDAFDPKGFSPEEEKALNAMLDLVENRLDSAIAQTDKTLAVLDQVFANMDARERG